MSIRATRTILVSPFFFSRNVLDAAGRERLTDNIASHVSKVQPFIRDRAIRTFSSTDRDYGRMIRRKVDHILTESKLGASVSRRVAGLSPPRAIPQNSGQYDRSSNARPSCPYGYSSKM